MPGWHTYHGLIHNNIIGMVTVSVPKPAMRSASEYASVRRMLPVIVIGWILSTALYCFLLYRFQDSTTIFGLTVKPSYCSGQDLLRCKRPDLFAFQVVSGISLTLCGMLGFYTWHVSGRSHSTIPRTAPGRLFGQLPEAELLAAWSFMFQSFDFAVSLTIPEHATPIMLAHHIMAATVSWCSIRYQCLHYYGVFFLGLTEVSSFFLVFIDLSKYYPPVDGTSFKLWLDICGPCFAVTFFYYRVILWWPESLRLFRDVRQIVKSGDVERIRPGTTWVLYLFLALNLPLGLLQLYWSTIIVAEAKKVLL
jgi:hypothetical protein